MVLIEPVDYNGIIANLLIVIEPQEYKLIRGLDMAVKHIPTGEVHSGSKGGTTGCGVDTRKNPSHWVNSHNKITCRKNGCKN